MRAIADEPPGDPPGATRPDGRDRAARITGRLGRPRAAFVAPGDSREPRERAGAGAPAPRPAGCDPSRRRPRQRHRRLADGGVGAARCPARIRAERVGDRTARPTRRAAHTPPGHTRSLRAELIFARPRFRVAGAPTPRSAPADVPPAHPSTCPRRAANASCRGADQECSCAPRAQGRADPAPAQSQCARARRGRVAPATMPTGQRPARRAKGNDQGGGAAALPIRGSTGRRSGCHACPGRQRRWLSPPPEPESRSHPPVLTSVHIILCAK